MEAATEEQTDLEIEGAEGAEPQETQIEGDPAEGQDAIAHGDAADAEKGRKDRQAERVRSHKALEARDAATRAENERLRTAIERMERTQSRTADAIERTLPQQKDPLQQKLEGLESRWRTAAKRMGSDPDAYAEWEQLGREINRIDAQIVARDTLREHQQTQPRQPPPDVQRLGAEFTWLSENAGARQATEAEIQRLVSAYRRDLSNPTVRYQTMREAAANVAKTWSLDPGYQQDPAGRERLSGTTGKPSGGGGGTAVDVAPTDDLMAIARARFPNDDDDTAWAKLKKNVISKLPKK